MTELSSLGGVCKLESIGFKFERRCNGAKQAFGNSLRLIYKLESMGFKFERRRDGMTELSRLRGSEGYAVRADVAGMAGLEPTISESKSGVLPLHYIPPRL